MAQPSSKIAEAFCGGEEGHEGDAKLRGVSINSVIIAALRLRETATIPLQPRLPGMAPGLGGFNIDPSPLRTGNVRDPVVLAPLPEDQWLRYYEPPCAKWWSGYAVPRFSGYSAPLVICAGVAIVVIAGLYLAGAQRQLDKLITITPFSSEALRDRKPDLPVEAERRLANPPLPVGIVAAGASDGATRTIEGLPDDLSPGGRSDHPSPVNNGTASAGSAAVLSTSSSSSAEPALTLPPLAASPNTVGQGSGTRAVTSKRDARLKHPHRKRTSALEDAGPSPTVFNLFSWEYLMGARPPPVQIQRSSKSPTRRTEGRRVKP